MIESDQIGQNISIEEFLRQLQPLFIALILIVIIRFIINYIISSLVERGKVTYVTRSIFMRTIDLILLFIAISIILHTFFAPYQIFIALTVLIIVLAILFLYELREFIAYINLQLMRRISGRVYEIHLPNHNKPIYGKIVSINPLETVIEDLYGRRIHVSNSLLMNSILREHVYSITLKITLRDLGEKPVEELNRIIKVIRNIESKVFRIDERKVLINEISSDKCVLKIIANPIVTPIRTIDLIELIERLNSNLSNYKPIVELVEFT